MSILEVLIAAIIMALIAIPLLTMFQGGVRTTKATIKEVVGANLVAELSEQITAIPFATVESQIPGGSDGCVLKSEDGSLADGKALNGRFAFHLSSLPEGYSRELELKRVGDDYLLAKCSITWRVNEERDRKIVVKKCVVRDSPLPR